VFTRRASGGDELDKHAWRLACAIATAASQVDPDGFYRALGSVQKILPDGSPRARWLFYYEWWMLRYKLFETLGVEPTNEAVHGLAESCYPRYAQLLTSGQRRLESAFRASLEMEPIEEDKMLPGEFAVVGGAALGLLLREPQPELDSMRPILAGYVAKYEQKIRELLGLSSS
jgi:hypothetical protein